MDNINALLEDRDNTYGAAWLKTGWALVDLVKQAASLPTRNILTSPALFAWLMILNKLHRLITSPDHADSWRDIAGYAQLVLQQVERDNQQPEVNNGSSE